MPLDPKEELRLLKESVSILDVVQEYSSIKRKGRYVFARCLCKQHRDSDPSVHIMPDKNIFYCFICNKGGSVLDAIMLAEGCSLKEAIQKLRQYYEQGAITKSPIINITPYALEPAPEQITDPETSRILALAADLFHEQLLASPQALAYLHQRGISNETISRFKIGWSPTNFPILHHLNRRFGISPGDIYQAGLVDDKWENVFKNRIVFPIYTLSEAGSQAIVYMTGRRIWESKSSRSPKYLGLPQRKAYKNIFALNVPVKRASIIVEGIVDAIALAQAGLDRDFSVIALLGLGHDRDFSALLRLGVFDNPAYLLLDNDKAGQKAVEKFLEAFARRASTPFLLVQGDRDLILSVSYPYTIFRTSLQFKDAGELLQQGQIDTLASEIRAHFAQHVTASSEKTPEQNTAQVDEIRQRWVKLGLS